MRLRVAVRRAALLAAACSWFGPAAGQTLVVLSSNGVRAAVDELKSECEHRVGRQVSIDYGTSSSLKERIAGGANVDVALATTDVIAELVKGGHLASNYVKPLGRAGIGVGIRAGGRKYPIGTADDIKRALLTAKSITYAQDGASRVHVERMFMELGIEAEMRAKTLLEQGSTRAAAKVVSGDAEILLTLISEILPVQGMELLGPLPGHFQNYVSFEAALGTKPQDGAAARAFISCLATGKPAETTFAAKGIER